MYTTGYLARECVFWQQPELFLFKKPTILGKGEVTGMLHGSCKMRYLTLSFINI